MKIAHLGIDSPFVDFLVAGFERHAPGSNELLIASGEEPTARPQAFGGPTTWVRPIAGEIDSVSARLAEADVVVVHGMTDFAALVCADLPPATVLVWSGFGFDYYVGRPAEKLTGSATLWLLRRDLALIPDGNGRLVPPHAVHLLEPRALDRVHQEVARRTDFLSTPVDADLAVFRRAFPGFAGEYRQLNYADLSTMAGDEGAVTGQDILVGNSSSWSNNHVDAFHLLADSELGDRRVVVPLTYGNPAYRDAVIQAGERLLGDRFLPIVDHLPLTEYLQLVRQCRVALFHHRRQQGLGNIVAALQQGSWVHLHKKNPLYEWFRERGIDVRSAGSLRSDVPTGDVPPETLARHREILADVWGTERVEENLRSFVRELEPRVGASRRRALRPRGFPGRRQR